MTATIYAICISEKRGELKKEITTANIIEGFGIEGDGHGGDWDRQVTCLNWGSVVKSNAEHNLQMGPGDFAENILIDGLDELHLQPGDQFQLGAGSKPDWQARSSQRGDPHLWRKLVTIRRFVLQSNSRRSAAEGRCCSEIVVMKLWQ